MKNQTIAIRQADGSFYPIISGGKAGKKRLLLAPAQDSQSGAKIELVRGEGPGMEDPQTFGTLQLDVSQSPDGEIELILTLDGEGNVTASAALVGTDERQELQGHLSDLVDQPAYSTPDLEAMDLSSLDELEEMDLSSPGDQDAQSQAAEEAEEKDTFEFDLDEQAPPKTDRQILDDDSLIGDGLDDLSFDMDDQDAQGGPVQAEDLGDLGDLGSFDDFGTEPSVAPEEPETDSLDLPSLDNLEGNLAVLPEESPDESLDDLDFSSEAVQLNQEAPESDDLLEDFGEVEDLTPLGESPLGDGRKTFEKGPDGFGLDLPFGEDSEGAETLSADAGGDFNFDDMDMGSLDSGDLDSSLDMDSPIGDFDSSDFDLGSAAVSSDDDLTLEGFPVPPPEEPAVLEGKPETSKGKAAPAAARKAPQVSGKFALVLSLGTLVVLLGIFLGLLFLNMTRMTMVPPIQSLDLRGVKEAVALASPPLPALSALPSGQDDEERRILSLEYYGTPHFYRQFPLTN